MLLLKLNRYKKIMIFTCQMTVKKNFNLRKINKFKLKK